MHGEQAWCIFLISGSIYSYFGTEIKHILNFWTAYKKKGDWGKKTKKPQKTYNQI